MAKFLSPILEHLRRLYAPRSRSRTPWEEADLPRLASDFILSLHGLLPPRLHCSPAGSRLLFSNDHRSRPGPNGYSRAFHSDCFPPSYAHLGSSGFTLPFRETTSLCLVSLPHRYSYLRLPSVDRRGHLLAFQGRLLWPEPRVSPRLELECSMNHLSTKRHAA